MKTYKKTQNTIFWGTFCPNMSKIIVFCKTLNTKIIELNVQAENQKKLMNYSSQKCLVETFFSLEKHNMDTLTQ